MVERKERAWSLSISPRLPPTLLPVRQLKSKHLDRDGTGGNCRRPRDTCHHTSALEREPAGRVPPHIFTTPRQQMSDSSCPIHTDRECAAVVQLKDKPQAPWRVQTTTSVNWHGDKPSWWGFISCWFVIPATGPLHFFSEFARRIMTFWEGRATTISQSLFFAEMTDSPYELHHQIEPCHLRLPISIPFFHHFLLLWRAAHLVHSHRIRQPGHSNWATDAA